MALKHFVGPYDPITGRFKIEYVPSSEKKAFMLDAYSSPKNMSFSLKRLSRKFSSPRKHPSSPRKYPEVREWGVRPSRRR